MFPHACFQFIKGINAWCSSLFHLKLPLMPPLTCTSYKSRNNMAKNVKLTIFTKQRLHQLLCIPHPINEWYWSCILPKEWNVTMNDMMQRITTMPMQPRTICRICTHGDWKNLETLTNGERRNQAQVDLEVRRGESKRLLMYQGQSLPRCTWKRFQRTHNCLRLSK